MRWFQRKEREDDLERELHSDLELEAEEQQEKGLSAQEARYAARRALGNTTLIQEETRALWGWTSLERLGQDLRYAGRALRQSPAYTLVVLISLGLGIGANSAIFNLLNAIVLRTLPVPNPHQLVQLTYTFPSNGPENVNSYFDYLHLQRFRTRAATLSGVFGGIQLNRVSVEASGVAGLAQCDAYTDNFFSVLGITPQRGRLFAAGDDREGADVALLSDRYWRSRFAADPSIVGRTIWINQLPFTVVGITPPEFFGIYAGVARDLWVPLHAIDRFTPDPKRWQQAFSSWLLLAGRLRPGVSPSQAEAELDVLHRRLLAEELTSSERSSSSFIQRLVRESHLMLRSAANGTPSALRRTYRFPLQLLLSVAAIVLLVSCANVANLVLARAGRRRREIAVRMTLGAGRGRMIRQVLMESLLLTVAGGVLALLLAWSGSTALLRVITMSDRPIVLDIRPDWRVFSFTAGVSLLTGLLFGLAPAIRGTRVDPISALKESARGVSGNTRAWDRTLVALQVALALVLVAGEGLFTRTLENLRNVDFGYRRENILLFSVDARLAGYRQGRSGALYRALLDRVTALPSVQSASVSIARPVDDQYSLEDRVGETDGRKLTDAESIKVAWNAMAPGYFSTLGTPFLRGHDFDLRDSDVESRIIVNEALARRAFPGQNPMGHKLNGAEIIGVVKDSLYAGARDQVRPVLYRPLLQSEGVYDPSGWVGAGSVSFELRYAAGRGLVEEVRQAVASVDRNVPIFNVKTLRVQTEESFLRERLLALISRLFAGLALLLASLGLYGLLAYAVASRTAEIGIRMALGACSWGVVWLVLRQTLVLVLLGIGLGIPVALVLAQYTRSLLFGVAPSDPVVLAVSVGCLTVVAVLAALLPARRASRIDPLIALRYE